MKGDDIKNTMKKIKADSRLLEKIKELENSKPKKVIFRTEFWGSVAAACWVLLIAILLFKFIGEDKDKDPLLQNTHTVSPTTTMHTPTITQEPTATPEITDTPTPKPTETPIPTPTPEPFMRLTLEKRTIQIKLPAGVTQMEDAEFVIAKGDIYSSVYNSSTKSYRLYKVNKATGEMIIVSPEVNELKTGKKIVLYKKGNSYYTNSYNWDNEKTVDINVDNVIGAYIVSDSGIIYQEKVSGIKSYVNYIYYDMNTKTTSKVYELVVYGNIIGGISVVLPEPLYVVNDLVVLLDSKLSKLKIYNVRDKNVNDFSVNLNGKYGVGLYNEEVYYTYGDKGIIMKVDLKNGNVKSESLEAITSSDGYLVVDENRIFLLNMNNMPGLFMQDMLTEKSYLIDNISIPAGGKLYVSGDLLAISEGINVSDRSISFTIAEFK